MNPIKLALRLVSLLFALSYNISFAQTETKQKLFLKNETLTLPANISAETVARLGARKAANDEKTLIIIQFKNIPGEAVRNRLKDQGVTLLEYIPDNAFTATFTGQMDVAALIDADVRSIFRPGPEHKVLPALLNGPIPGHIRKVAGKLDLRISYAQSFTHEEVIQDLKNNGFETVSSDFAAYQILEVRIPENKILELASFPWLQYIEPTPAPTVSLNDKSTAATAANVLNSTNILGYKLTGEGVVVGIGDNANLMRHEDLSKRVISFVELDNTAHGVHVAGTVAGAGLINEKFQGYAPKSLLIARGNSSIWRYAQELVQQFGMTLTNNSYAPSTNNTCADFGYYGSDSYLLDRQAFLFPSLQHVFAGGNSGASTVCTEQMSGFGNILSEYPSAKNVISVGQTQVNASISPESSKGPTRDGRIKPELTAPGTSIYSTVPNNGYQPATGTSMAAPAVTGGLALLYERYRQLHGQNNPKNALMKALLCNGASDMGLPGPDYSYGFGQMNLLRSVTMLDKGHYINAQLDHQATNRHEITVPANTARLKVMLYWNDPAASMLTGVKTLVNNLDLLITKPGNAESLPQFPNMTNPSAAAVAGVDSVNNMEQIVIEAPAAGTYSIKVSGKAIPQGPQEYFLVYDIIEAATVVTYPAAGTHLCKGDAINICWDSYGGNAGTTNVSYSLNNGNSWTVINASVAAGVRQLSWTVPDAATGNAKIRVQNASGAMTESGTFTILGAPALSLQPVQCEGYIALQWTRVTGATDYEIMIHSNNEMKSLAFTTDSKFTVSALSPDSTYLLSVRARINQVPGRRSTAILRKPNNGSCEGTISDNDIKIESVISPARSGRMFTSTAYGNHQPITVRIKNLDDQPSNRPFEIGYSIGNGPTHWETVSTPIAKHSFLDYTFSRTADMTNPGEYPLTVRMKLDGAAAETGNPLVTKLRQLANPKLTLPFMDKVESVPVQEVLSGVLGLSGADNYDFVQMGGYARLRTNVGSGLAYSPGNAYILDTKQQTSNPNQSFLEATYNLSDYNAQHDDVRLSFRHSTYGYYSHYDFNRVYIRGNETDPWITAYILQSADYADVDKNYRLASVDLSAILKKNNQQFSPNFQVRWASEAYHMFPNDGYAIDDIQLFKTSSDIELVRMEAPAVSVCDQFAGTPIQVVFKNKGTDDCFNVPVKMSFDGQITDHTIPVIRKDSTVTLSLDYPYAVYTQGTHNLQVWSEKGNDLNVRNDSARAVLQTAGYISTFPHLENFEGGNGSWYTTGNNSSWQFGKPGNPLARAASGQQVWKTNLNGNYNNDEESYLYSPCYYAGWMSRPTLSFSASMDMEQCAQNDCDMAYIEYNVGFGWERLGSKGQGVNWYNAEATGKGSWQGPATSGWRVYTIPLPESSYLRFRFVFKSNASGVAGGIAIDDIHVYDLVNEIHEAGTVATGVSLPQVEGDDWVPFTYNGRVIASIHPHGQQLDKTTVKMFLNNGAVRESNNQYYLDRSIVIDAQNKSFAQPVGVRLYIMDSETSKLVSAPVKNGVEKPASAYELSVTKYSGDNEDGSLSNNTRDIWSFYPQSAVTKVPYHKGYYLEFETKSFSEFWFARDYIGIRDALPVELASFSASKVNAESGVSVQLKWATSSEKDFSHFTVQVATGAQNVKKGIFTDLVQVEGKGDLSQTYLFTDKNVDTKGPRYYRLQMVDSDMSFRHSMIRAIVFDDPETSQVFPNPSKGMFQVELGSNYNGGGQISVFDLSGKVRHKSGFSLKPAGQHLEVDLTSSDLPPGPYFIRVNSGLREESFKVMKE